MPGLDTFNPSAHFASLTLTGTYPSLIIQSPAARRLRIVIGLILISLAVLGIVLQSAGMKSYGNLCLYIMCGISVLYFIIYQVLSRRY